METTRLIPAAAVCEQLNVSRGTLRQLVRRGALPAIRLSGTCIRFRASDIEQFIAAREVRS
jgi:excisionase family DNA binding protein